MVPAANDSFIHFSIASLPPLIQSLYEWRAWRQEGDQWYSHRGNVVVKIGLYCCQVFLGLEKKVSRAGGDTSGDLKEK